MEIRENDFENYGEVDCKARMKVTTIKTTGALPFFSLSIRRTGKDEYQAYAEFTQDMLLVQTENGQTTNVKEVVLLTGRLVDIVSFTNGITGEKDTMSRVVDEDKKEEKKKEKETK